MVPNLSKGAGIKGTALYVLHDVREEGARAIGAALTPEHQSAHRVGMTATRNLSTDDPDLAWRLMCATAKNQDALKQAAGVRRGGRPTEKFCGHLSLSWEQGTQPDRAEILRAAEGALGALGWEKLQALIVEHRDHDHAHCHIVVNLIDPDTGRAAPNAKNDFEKVQRWAHEYDQARGIEVCPNRAARMNVAPDEPTPPEPKRWLSRKEFEAIRETERQEHRSAALSRYQQAAAEVREQFRPEWSNLYREQRAELRAFDKEARELREALASCRTRAARADFYNEHRDLILKGIDAGQRPGNTYTLLGAAFLRGALERSQSDSRSAILEQHGQAKNDLQERHTGARQDAYRAAWRQPAPVAAVAVSEQAKGEPGGTAQPTVVVAVSLATSTASINTHTLSRGRTEDGARDPQRDLDRAAERIARQSPRAANSNRRQPAPATEATQQPKEAAKAPPLSDLEQLRAKADARNAAIRQHHAAASMPYDPEHQRGRRRD